MREESKESKRVKKRVDPRRQFGGAVIVIHFGTSMNSRRTVFGS